MSPNRRSWVRQSWQGALLLVVLCCGCQSVRYYKQAVSGQFELWRRQQPIDRLLASTNTSRTLKGRLQLVLELRQFAEAELHLPANGHYLRYADLQRRFVVWNVYAAPEFSLTPKSWWYPVVGSLDYRGYFSEPQAHAEAQRLRQKGFDVYVGGVSAYSTLGWFRDPVLNTFIDYADADLAELLFHELAHQRLFVSGDTEFNEAFATAVAEEGTRRWIEAHGSASDVSEYRAQSLRTDQFAQLIAGARERLDLLYTNTPFKLIGPRPAESAQVSAARAQKQRILDELRRQYLNLKAGQGGHFDYDAWFNQPLNNAQLNTVDTYYALVPQFRQALRRMNGDLERFFGAVDASRKLKKEERRLRLAELAAPSGQAALE